jgi:hypothetical protein
MISTEKIIIDGLQFKHTDKSPKKDEPQAPYKSGTSSQKHHQRRPSPQWADEF